MTIYFSIQCITKDSMDFKILNFIKNKITNFKENLNGKSCVNKTNRLNRLKCLK